MISLTAFFTGVILAYVHVFFTGSIVFEPALKGWSSLYPNFDLTPFVNLEQLTTLFFLDRSSLYRGNHCSHLASRDHRP